MRCAERKGVVRGGWWGAGGKCVLADRALFLFFDEKLYFYMLFSYEGSRGRAGGWVVLQCLMC